MKAIYIKNPIRKLFIAGRVVTVSYLDIIDVPIDVFFQIEKLGFKNFETYSKTKIYEKRRREFDSKNSGNCYIRNSLSEV